MKVILIPTDHQVESDSVPFYESEKPLGERIDKALDAVYNGQNRPFFTHLDNGETGFIVIASEKVSEEVLREKIVGAWYEQDGLDLNDGPIEVEI